MKSKFEWYFPPSTQEVDEAWASGILTVDANVLLDLYRYHASTCQSLMEAMESFGERVWISNQAAEEFFRNRKGVIVTAEKTFQDARSRITDLSSALQGSIGTLRSLRLVPSTSLDKLAASVEAAIADTATGLETARSNHPDYLKDDPILERLLKLFDGRVGDAPGDEDRKKLVAEAEKRRAARTPPGYLDERKEGDRTSGDFILWSQVLDFSASKDVPILLVTSERKDDWWEQRDGKTLNPRLELIKEAFQKTGRRIYIYQTDHFLKQAAARKLTSVDKGDVTDSVEEIREVSDQRTRRRAEIAPAVRVLQEVIHADPLHNMGLLEIELLRPVPTLTGSGHLDPHMFNPPNIIARIMSMPDNCPLLAVSAGTGTDFDFNVHVRSIDRSVPLPVGHYVIEYEASCRPEPSTDQVALGLPDA